MRSRSLWGQLIFKMYVFFLTPQSTQVNNSCSRSWVHIYHVYVRVATRIEIREKSGVFLMEKVREIPEKLLKSVKSLGKMQLF